MLTSSVAARVLHHISHFIFCGAFERPLCRLCQADRPQHAVASVENGLSPTSRPIKTKKNTPQTPQQTSPPSLACRSLEKCNSCTNSISPMNEPATLERVLNQQSQRKVEKETREQITERNERRKEKDRKWSREKKEKRKKTARKAIKEEMW